MEKITTGDGSETFFSSAYGETYKSKSGALEEARKKFIEPCKVKPGMRILDIGFGLGYNLLAALETTNDLDIVSLEKDAKSLNLVQMISVPSELESTYEKIKSCAKNLSFQEAHTSIKIILGDATKTIHTVDGVFDAVFLDPFSPKKNPELWTAEFFSEIFKRMRSGAILATYSCAGSVRRNLIYAGFEVCDGPCVGRRAPSTIARKR